MATVNHPTAYPIRNNRDWVITYTQKDVDMIRGQIEETQSLKRRWMVLALIVSIAAFVGVLVLLFSSYALYSSSESSKAKLSAENAALTASADRAQQQLDARLAQDSADAKTQADAQSNLDKLLPAVLGGSAGPTEIARFARMVHALPGGRIEVQQAPPNKLFRNWKTSDGRVTEIFTLVGGFVDGRWVIYSNLVARRASAD